ncbi:MAG: leucine-rich repeat protein, partial [Agathobacter sp.]
CSSLQSITLPELPAVTNCNSMFNSCSSLQSITLPELPAVTNCQSMFYYCTSLQSITLPELPAVTNCQGMFNSCKKLQSLSINMPLCTNFSTFVYNCLNMKDVEIVDVHSATSISFDFCNSLENVTCVNELPKCNIGFGSCSKLTLDSITNIVTKLQDLTGEDSKTLTFHSTAKKLLTEELIAEATSKNWTIA